jgi:hypothetical protein
MAHEFPYKLAFEARKKDLLAERKKHEAAKKPEQTEKEKSEN